VYVSSVNHFKTKLDTHWSNQKMIHSYRALEQNFNEPEAGVFHNKLHKLTVSDYVFSHLGVRIKAHNSLCVAFSYE